MHRLPKTDDVLRVAERVVWFKPPHEALDDPIELLAYVMTYGVIEDVNIIRRHLSLDDFRVALEEAPPGIFDARSWAYWNLVCGRDPGSPLPRRRL